MSDNDYLTDLYQKIATLLPIEEHEFRKIYTELLNVSDLSVDGYIKKRHKQLLAKGFSVQEIYQAIGSELPRLLFNGPQLTNRQIKRLIYKTRVKNKE